MPRASRFGHRRRFSSPMQAQPEPTTRIIVPPHDIAGTTDNDARTAGRFSVLATVAREAVARWFRAGTRCLWAAG